MRWVINIEGVVALAFIVCSVWNRSGGLLQHEYRHARLFSPVLLILLLLVFVPSLWFPLVSDDYILITQADHFSGSLLKPFTVPGGDGSYRPVGYALLIGAGKWAHTDTFHWHVISLIIHIANVLMLYGAAYYSFGRDDVAVVAVAIFAVHGTRPEAVTWIAGRWDVLAGFFALAGLLAFLRFYDTGSWLMCLASNVLVGVAIMCKESAYAFPAIAVAFVATRPFSRRILATLIAPAVMLVYRFILFHGPGGYVDPHTGRAQILGIHLLPTVNAVFLRLWAVLMFPINWSERPEWYLIAAVAGMLVCLAIVVRSHQATGVLILAVCTLVTALPAIHLLGIGADLLGSRVIYLPSIPFALLLSLLVTSIPRPHLRHAVIVCLVFFYAATIVHNLGIWARVSALADSTCVRAAGAFAGTPEAMVVGIPIAIEGVNFFANGLPQCVALHSTTAPPMKWFVTHDTRQAPEQPSVKVLVWDGESRQLR